MIAEQFGVKNQSAGNPPAGPKTKAERRTFFLNVSRSGVPVPTCTPTETTAARHL